jgi:hypothetical protein
VFASTTIEPLIHGVGERCAISLFDSFRTRSTVSMPGMITEALRPEIALVGTDLAGGPGSLATFEAEVTGLDQWAGYPTAVVQEFERDGVRGVTAELMFRDGLAVQLDQASLEITHHWESANTPDGSSVTLLRQVSIRSEFASPCEPFAFLKDVGSPFADLVTLALDRPSRIRHVRAGSTPDENGRRSWFDVLYQPMGSEADDGEPVLPDRILFSLADVPTTRHADLLTNWFEIVGRFGRVCDMLFSIRRAPNTFLENRFLTLAQAAELLHRLHATLPQTTQPKETFDEQVASILDAVHPDDRDLVEAQLQWANEPRLRRRLKDLRELLGEEGKGRFPPAFINSLVVTRNYLTHYADDLEAAAASGGDLHHLSEMLRYFISAVLMVELGFDTAQVVQMLDRNRTFSWTREQLFPG